MAVTPSWIALVEVTEDGGQPHRPGLKLSCKLREERREALHYGDQTLGSWSVFHASQLNPVPELLGRCSAVTIQAEHDREIVVVLTAGDVVHLKHRLSLTQNLWIALATQHTGGVRWESALGSSPAKVAPDWVTFSHRRGPSG